MKKIISLMLVAIITLVGCSGGSDEVELTIIQDKVEIIEALEGLAKIYSEQTEGVSVEILGFQGNYAQQLASSLGSSTAPIVFSSNGASGLETYKDYMLPIEGIGIMEKAVPGSLNQVTVDGNVLGIPTAMAGLGYIYNKNILDEAGLTVADFATPGQFAKSCKLLDSSGYKCVGVAPEGYFISAHLMNVPLSLNGTPTKNLEAIANQKLDITTDKAWTEWAKQLAAFRSYMPNILSYSYDNQINDFANSKTAIISQGVWAQPLLNDYDIDFEYHFMPVQVNGNSKLSTGITQYYHINNEASVEEQEAAKAFLNWLYTDEEAKQVILDKFGIIPTYSGFDTSQFDTLNSEIYEAANSGNSLPVGYSYIPRGMIEPTLKPIMEKFFSGNIDEGEMLEEIQEALIDELN